MSSNSLSQRWQEGDELCGLATLVHGLIEGIVGPTIALLSSLVGKEVFSLTYKIGKARSSDPVFGNGLWTVPIITFFLCKFGWDSSTTLFKHRNFPPDNIFGETLRSADCTAYCYSLKWSLCGGNFDSNQLLRHDFQCHLIRNCYRKSQVLIKGIKPTDNGLNNSKSRS